MKKTIVVGILVTLTLLFAVTCVSASWWDTDFSYRKQITLTHVNTSGDTLTNYPAFINVTKELSMQSDFDDIRFIDNSGNLMAYELENYTASYGLFWVNITSLANSGTSFWMYYGNNNAASATNPTAVWDSSAKMVQHLENIYDSTSYNNDATNHNAEYTFGLIDGAYDFDGSTSYFNCGNDPSLDITNALTIEAWVKALPIQNESDANIDITAHLTFDDGPKTTMVVNWRTTSSTDSVVEYGETESYGSQASGDSGTLHSVKITGLTADTQYHYRVVVNGTSAEHNKGSFYTAPNGTNFTFFTTGDNRNNPSLWNEVVETIRKNFARFIIHSGDTCGAGTTSDWREQYFNALTGMRNIPTMVAWGNHEWNGGSGEQNAKDFFAHPVQNFLPNGQFNLGDMGWSKTGNHSGTYWSKDEGKDGGECEHIVSTGAGASYTNSLNRYCNPDIIIDEHCKIEFDAKTISGNTTLTVRLSGNGVDFNSILTGEWQHFSEEGTFTANRIYAYLIGAGECLIDNVKITRIVPDEQTNEHYFSYDYGSYHFIHLLTESGGSAEGLAVASNQYKWLKEDLEDNRHKRIIVAYHRPDFVSSGQDGATGHSPLEFPDTYNNIRPLLERYNVLLVINGHQHWYEWFEDKGVAHVISAGGGAPTYSWNGNDRHYASKYLKDGSNAHHYTKVECEENKVDLTTYWIDTPRKILDQRTIKIPVRDGLLGEWKFNEDDHYANETIDSSGNGLHAALTGFGAGNGIVDGKLEFHNTGECYATKQDDRFKISDRIVLEAWVEIDDLTYNYRDILVTFNNHQYGIYAKKSDYGFRFRVKNESGYEFACDTDIIPEVGKKYHLIGVVDTGTHKAKIFLNGIEMDETNFTDNISTVVNTIGIGRGLHAGNQNEGKLGVARIYHPSAEDITKWLSGEYVSHNFEAERDQYLPRIVRDGLVSWWNFEEVNASGYKNTGDTEDKWGNNNGTLTNFTANYGVLSYPDKYAYRICRFQESDSSYITMGNPAELQISDRIVVEGWFKPEDIESSGYQDFFGKGNGTADTYYVAKRATNSISTKINNSYYTEAYNFENDKWYHLVLMYDGAIAKLFINNVLITNEVLVGASFNSTEDFNIGGQICHLPDYFDGRVSSVKVYNPTSVQMAEWNSGNNVEANWDAEKGRFGYYEDPTDEPVYGINKGDSYGIVSDIDLEKVYVSINNHTLGGAITSGYKYLVQTYDGTTQKLYINGVFSDSQSFVESININSNNFVIGDTVSYNGTIDEVRIYNRALREEEINQSYQLITNQSNWVSWGGAEEIIVGIHTTGGLVDTTITSYTLLGILGIVFLVTFILSVLFTIHNSEEVNYTAILIGFVTLLGFFILLFIMLPLFDTIISAIGG